MNEKPTEKELERIEETLRIDKSYFKNFEKGKKEKPNGEEEKNFIEEKKPMSHADITRSEMTYMPSYEPGENMKKDAPHMALKDIGERLEVYDQSTSVEDEQVTIMKRLIICYYSIIKKQIKDIVPKHIICHLVTETKIKMNSYLITELNAVSRLN